MEEQMYQKQINSKKHLVSLVSGKQFLGAFPPFFEKLGVSGHRYQTNSSSEAMVIVGILTEALLAEVVIWFGKGLSVGASAVVPTT